MTSSDLFEDFDLERDHSTTPEDMRALRTLQHPVPELDFVSQVEVLFEALPDLAKTPRHTTFANWPPFEL